MRGGSPLENGFYLDEIETPNINHFPSQGSSAGPIGLLNVDLIQRRLQAESTSFAAVLDEMRCEMAASYLRSSQMSITEIGFLLGYPETSAFHRAFRAWTGQTPAGFRSAQCV